MYRALSGPTDWILRYIKLPFLERCFEHNVLRIYQFIILDRQLCNTILWRNITKEV